MNALLNGPFHQMKRRTESFSHFIDFLPTKGATFCQNNPVLGGRWNRLYPTPRIGLFVRPSVIGTCNRVKDHGHMHHSYLHHTHMHQDQGSYIFASRIHASCKYSLGSRIIDMCIIQYIHASGSRIMNVCIIHICIIHIIHICIRIKNHIYLHRGYMRHTNIHRYQGS